MKKTIAVLSFLVVLLASCGSDAVYKEYVSLPGYVWSKNNTVVLKAALDKPLPNANVFINVRYGTAYPFESLVVVLKTTNPAQKTDTHNYTIPLRDANDKNLGSGMGDMWDVQFPIGKNIALEQGTYTYELSHQMPDNDIPMLVDMGIQIDDTSKK